MEEWTPPHPRRLPTECELNENLEQIRELDEKIAGLTKQLAQLRRDRDSRASFITAFRRIPPEILCEIVLYAIELGQSPLKVARVCLCMRDAIYGIKQLWTDIFIAHSMSIGKPKRAIACKNNEWLQILLERSDPLPLSICVGQPRKVIKLMRNLTSISRRIENLIINVTHKSDLNIPPYDLTGLRLLSISLPFRSKGDLNFTKYLDLLPSQLNSAFKLSISMPFGSACGILAHHACSGLVNAIINICSPIASPPDGFTVSLPMLQTLEITYPSYLSMFSLPSLRHLLVRGSYECDTDFNFYDSDDEEEAELSEIQFILHLEDVPEGILHLELEDLVITTSGFQPTVLSNLSTMKIIGGLNIQEEATGMLHVPRLEEVTVSRGWLQLEFHEGEDQEDLYSVFFGDTGLVQSNIIKRLYLTNTDPAEIKRSSLLDENVLPGLSYIDISTPTYFSWYDLNDFEERLASARPDVQLVTS